MDKRNVGQKTIDGTKRLLVEPFGSFMLAEYQITFQNGAPSEVHEWYFLFEL